MVTTRLHAALPCLAFQTPVLVLPGGQKGVVNPRFGGLAEHMWHCSTDELTAGEAHYDFDNPPDNPTTYLPIRENLEKAMTTWAAGRP